jgi:hypothetical protein
MQIVDFASLQAAVADWLNRTDLTARIPDFIGLAEVRMMRKLRMRLLEADATTTAPPGARLISLPTDYREPLNFWWNNGADREPLRFVPPELLDVYTAASRPFCWSIDGNNVAFERPCDQAYSPVRFGSHQCPSDAIPRRLPLRLPGRSRALHEGQGRAGHVG